MKAALKKRGRRDVLREKKSEKQRGKEQRELVPQKVRKNACLTGGWGLTGPKAGQALLKQRLGPPEEKEQSSGGEALRSKTGGGPTVWRKPSGKSNILKGR